MGYFTSEQLDELAAYFYRMERRDDGLFHFHRDPTTYANIWAAMAVNTGAPNTSTGNLVAAAPYGLPSRAKGGIFGVSVSSGVAAALVAFAPNDGRAVVTKDIVPARPAVAGLDDSGWFACLFGVGVGGLSNGSISARAFVANCTVTLWILGWVM